MTMTQKDFNQIFDHTILKPPTTEENLRRVCADAVRYGFCSVAVNTGLVKACADMLRNSSVKVDAAVGFPLGITTITQKVSEATEAIANGAGEVDYVVNIGKVKEGNFDYIREEMEQMIFVCRQKGVVCKVIFENCYLTDEEKITLCSIASELKPDYIKTSTGFGPSSATVEDVILMREHVSADVKVKAAGGVRDLESCLSMLEAGAVRIGCSCSVSIADEYKRMIEGA